MTPDLATPITLRFEIREADLRDHDTQIVRESPEWRGYRDSIRSRNRSNAHNTLVAFALAAGFGLASTVTRDSPRVIFGVLAFTCALLGITALFRPASQKRLNDSLAAQEREQDPNRTDRTLFGPTTLVMDAHGIRWTSPYIDSRMSWPVFFGVFVFSGFVSVQGFTKVCIVPRRAFASEHDLETFVDLARRHLAAHRCDTAARLRVYFEAFAASCYKCGYSLQGSAGTACPECGLELTLSMFPDAMHHYTPPPPNNPAS
jgi:rubrerythrin